VNRHLPFFLIFWWYPNFGHILRSSWSVRTKLGLLERSYSLLCKNVKRDHSHITQRCIQVFFGPLVTQNHTNPPLFKIFRKAISDSPYPPKALRNMWMIPKLEFTVFPRFWNHVIVPIWKNFATFWNYFYMFGNITTNDRLHHKQWLWLEGSV
jgi:hypothetical protein